MTDFDHEITRGYRLAVLRAPLRVLPSLREFCDDNGFEFVDARWRRWDRNFMIFSALMFALSGDWMMLAFALWWGREWTEAH